MRQRPGLTTALLIAAIAFTLVTLAGAAVLIGPAGFRPAPSTTPVAHATVRPSASPTSEAGSVPGLTAAGMAYDGSSGRMLLFGGSFGEVGCGQGQGLPSDQTWAWNGRQWQRLAMSTSPSARTAPGLAYDAVHHTVVLRDGAGSTGYLDETWTWNGSRWLLQSPPQSAPVWVASLNGTQYTLPAAEPMFWNPDWQTVELFAYARISGWSYDVPELSQIWSWTGNTWSQVAAGGTPPSGYGTHKSDLAYDASAHQIVMFGRANGTPTTWTFDGTNWNRPITGGPSA